MHDAVDPPGPTGDFNTFYRKNVFAPLSLVNTVWNYDWTSGVDVRFVFSPPDGFQRDYAVMQPFPGVIPGATLVTVDFRVELIVAYGAAAPGYTYEVSGLKKLTTNADRHGDTRGLDLTFTLADLTTARHTQAFVETLQPGPYTTHTVDVSAIVDEITTQPGYDETIHHVTLLIRALSPQQTGPYVNKQAAVYAENMVVTP